MSDWQVTSGQRRQRSNPAPVDVWVRAVIIAIALLYCAVGYFVYFGIPLPTDTDRKHFRAEVERFQSDLKSADDPVSIVFIGTSRIKNIALDRDLVVKAARDAGLTRPVV